MVIQLPDLDGEATIGIADVLRAREAWLADAPAPYQRLLDARLEHEHVVASGANPVANVSPL